MRECGAVTMAVTMAPKQGRYGTDQGPLQCYTKLMACAAATGDHAAALRLYKLLQEDGVRPNTCAAARVKGLWSRAHIQGMGHGAMTGWRPPGHLRSNSLGSVGGKT